ncbi:MAG: metallophosphoesterase, partial [Chloroflexota bacterium]|nr:metallophosphoesterase [Chloroflexota bacterium]
MKIAVLADIHANYPALLEVAEHVQRWGPDAVFVAGDTVNRGPRSLECLRFVQERVENEGWRVIRGNHEGYVIWHARPDAPRSGTLFDVFRYSYWTYEQLGADVSVLKALPKQVSQNHSEAGEFRVVHASM